MGQEGTTVCKSVIEDLAKSKVDVLVLFIGYQNNIFESCEWSLGQSLKDISDLPLGSHI
jgi:hypothetical protein